MAAGVLRRLLGCPLDFLILAAVWTLATVWAVTLYVGAASHPLRLDGLLLLIGGVLALAILLNAIYFVGFIGGCGQTPAKMLLGVRVVRRDGGRPGYLRAAVRWVGWGLGVLTLGLGFAVALLDADRRALHDWLAGTRVVRT